jgi:hypothetical protein
MKYIKVIIILFCLIIISCNDNPVVIQQSNTPVYNKIFSLSNDTVKYELWSATGTQLYYGYNDLGIKVFLNGVEQKTGTVKFEPRMTHFIGTYAHGTPAKQSFYYNSQKGFFTGYASFIMVSDTFSIWLADFSIDKRYRIKDSIFNVVPNSSHKIIAWPNIPDEYIYYISLIAPFDPVKGLNDFSVVMSRAHNDSNFTEVDSAQIFIRTLIEATGQTSNNNVNPVWIGEGKYKGVINMPNTGTWSVFDSVIYQGILKTNVPSPKFTFTIP